MNKNIYFQVLQYDLSGNGKIDLLDFKINLELPKEMTVSSIILILSLDFQLKVGKVLFGFNF